MHYRNLTNESSFIGWVHSAWLGNQADIQRKLFTITKKLGQETDHYVSKISIDNLEHIGNANVIYKLTNLFDI